MLKTKILCLLFPLILLAELSSSSDNSSIFIEKTFSFEESLLTFKKVNGYDMIYIPDAVPLVKLGYPSLPQLGLKFIIPPNATAKKVDVIVNDEKVIPGEFNILPSQPPVRLSANAEEIVFVEPNTDVYKSKNPYPENLASKTHTGTKCGYRIVSFSFYPIQYTPAEKKLTLIKDFTVRLHYDYEKSPRKEITPMQKYEFGNSVRKIVMNPEDIETYAPKTKGKTRDEPTWKMVIISPNNDDWIDSLAILKEWKNKKGVSCAIKNLHDIYNEYDGDDNPEKIKNFIIDMWNNHGTIWVLFGADHGTNQMNSIPCRGVFAKAPSGGHEDWSLPCERYYEDVEEWNFDEDSKYGEDTDGPGGGQLDWYSDVYVGRMFANNDGEAGKYVRRILKYEKNPPDNYTRKALFYSSYYRMTLGYKLCGLLVTDVCAEEIPSSWFTGGNADHPGYHYKEYDYVQEPIEINNYESGQQIIDSMNMGYGFVCVASHGDKNLIMSKYGDSPCPPNISISSSDINDAVNGLSPGDKVGIHTGACCFVGAFDQTIPCIAEDIYDKGSIGGAWNSRYGFHDPNSEAFPTTLSNGLVWQFFAHAFNNSDYQLGKAVAEAKDHFTGELLTNGEWNWALKTYNTFGDPELPMWTGEEEPLNLTVQYPPEVPSGPSNFTVTVEYSGNPVSNARVCCTEDLSGLPMDVQFTDGNGEATLSINPSELIHVTVTKHNYRPFEGTVFIIPFNLTLVNIEVAIGETKSYKAVNNIYTADPNKPFIIRGNGSSGGNVTMEAGNSINLYPGFAAQEGCDFHAFINTSLIASSKEIKGSAVPLSYDLKEKKPLSALSESFASTEKSTTETLTLSEKEKEPIPTVFSCAQNYPNPFMRNTTIKYGLPKNCTNVNLTIFNLAGQAVKTLVDGQQSAGFKSISWDGTNSAGVQVPQGIYFYVFRADDFEDHRKMVLLK